MNPANAHYQDVVESVERKRPFKQFNFYYHLLTDDKNERNYECWIDYLLDHYSMYRKYGWNDFESQTTSLMDGLEALIERK